MVFDAKLQPMEPLNTRIISSAGLIINGATGEVHNRHNPDTLNHRLSPVNKRVLLVLIQHPGQVTSRQDLFDQVWPNQMVSDDALTRAIADLRAQLKPLTETKPLIETIPKTGYRWVHETQPHDTEHQKTDTAQQPSFLRQNSLLVVVGLMLGLILVMGSVHWLVRDIRPNLTPLVILPATSQGPPPINVQSALMKSAHQYADLAYLSSHAIQSHQGSPFPYFSHKYGVRWFIESQWSTESGTPQLTLRLIDAKTGLVSHSSSQAVHDETQARQLCGEFMAFVADL